MTLLQFRKYLREVSGRQDLIDMSGETLGSGIVDVHINAGSRYLDRAAQVDKSVGRMFALDTGNNAVFSFQQCRSVLEVWVATQTARWQLTPLTFEEMRSKFPQGEKNVNPGNPLYFMVAKLRPIPDQLDAAEITALDWVTKYMDVLTSSHFTYTGVVIAPRADEDIMVEVVGHFYSNELMANEDINNWTETSPELLYMATMMQIEIVNRNTQGKNDWLSSINDSMEQLNMDAIEHNAFVASEMQG